ncbi:hypothetical protein KDW_07800 [Dictyobacter vulcani]|uniref:Uncharacterized protein n=2 Tax=Dictyobacter vulcani TaxID=2607529 RepID=A0A5J4KCT6_9CHLR|nr:hypothetical protein KDW_07800 [Dictyobacter vulcani]
MQQFEGDYEQFDDSEMPQRPFIQTEHGKRYPRQRSEQGPEKHVTRLPNGRVIKGSRPAQRKNAQFWTDIDDDTEKLVEQVTERTPVEDPDAEDSRSTSTNRAPRRSGTSRGKKVGKKAESKKSSGPSGPKPSQKGFKWPSQQ